MKDREFRQMLHRNDQNSWRQNTSAIYLSCQNTNVESTGVIDTLFY